LRVTDIPAQDAFNMQSLHHLSTAMQ